MFPGELLGLEECLVQLLDLFRLALGVRADHAECFCRAACCGCGCFFLLLLPRTGRFDFLGGGAEMPLQPSFFLHCGFLPEDVFVFCVGLREVVEAESLCELQVSAALVVALDQKIDAPFDVGRRTLPATSEVLVVLDFELADVFFDLAQIFVNSPHAPRQLPSFHARLAGQNRRR